MERRFSLFFILFFSLLILFVLRQEILRLTGFFAYGPPQEEYEWWNSSWRYRVRIDVYSGDYDRKEWPVEYQINFSSLLESGTFDENSTRVIEYDSGGNVIQEVPFQFDKNESYNSSTNAVGTLIFLLNGTTSPNTNRTFFVYFDTTENGVKTKPFYPTNLSFMSNGEEFNVSNQILTWYIDTKRGENTSGIYQVSDIFAPIGEASKTLEYVQYSNGTYNFSFNFINNYTNTSGPIRIKVKQVGYETFWNDTNNYTNEGLMEKIYYFYAKNPWIKVEQVFKNIASYSITRNSTAAGALAFDVGRGWPTGYDTLGNTTDPGSWYWAKDEGVSSHVGVLNLYESIPNFYATENSSAGRIGIELDTVTISPGNYIKQISVLHFNDSQPDDNQFKALRIRLLNNVEIYQHNPETIIVYIDPSTNATIYNRNETVLITSNITYDPYNLSYYVNATLNMGTLSESDDVTIILYDDGTHGDLTANDKVFTNIFNISNSATLGEWEINISVFDQDGIFLNSSLTYFNVTDWLNVIVNISNPTGIANRVVYANVTVKNYRNDTGIEGATLNCSYDGTQVTNISEVGGGNYKLNFTVTQEGSFTLNCSAEKNNNTGWGTDDFWAESPTTLAQVTTQPTNYTATNITLFNSENFTFNATASNIGNATAYDLNITSYPPTGWNIEPSLYNCGDVPNGTSCERSFNVSIPAGTLPGTYQIEVNITWRNPNDTPANNYTLFNVTVASNPVINVVEVSMTATVADGTEEYIGNFTVESLGNDNATDISFSVIGLDEFQFEFVPPNISTLPAGENSSVAVNVTIPLDYSPGTYEGKINVSAVNGGWDAINVSITVPENTSLEITSIPPSYTVENITLSQGATFNLTAKVENIGEGRARFVNISITVPPNWTSEPSFYSCGNLTPDSICKKDFNISVPNATLPDTYYVNFTVEWTNLDSTYMTNETSVPVTVASNPVINVVEVSMTATVADGTEEYIGNFTVESLGNDNATDISFSVIGLDEFQFEFVPSLISLIQPGLNVSVAVNVSVPVKYPNGTYNGKINVSAANNGWDVVNVSITVPENRTWFLTPTYCQKFETPDEGTACLVEVHNEGNTYINFTVSPPEGNYTKPNVTSFGVERNSTYTFEITYNVTGVPKAEYNSTYFINATQPDANPTYEILKVTLLPWVEPIVEIEIIPTSNEQFESFDIYANVTDKSTKGIAWTKINVTRPDGKVDTENMTLIDTQGNLTRWYISYPDNWGDSSKRGNYSVVVYAQDNVGAVGNATSQFTVYAKLVVNTSTLSDTYYQGDDGSISYSVSDATGNGLGDLNVTLKIFNPNSQKIFEETHLTQSDGTIQPLPTFSISSDAPTGTYTLVTSCVYVDEIANVTVVKEVNSTFEVLTRTAGGLFVDIETTVNWYPDNVMKFGIMIYNAEGGAVDPVELNFTVYDPADNIYFSVDLDDLTRESKGFYTYKYAMPSDTATGMYLAVVNVSDGKFVTQSMVAFRVTAGGPYDVRIKLLENEVYQGDYLDFEIVIENKGEVSQDVLLEYWISDDAGNQYSSASETVYTPALSNQSFTRNLYIYSTQALGNYYLNARVTFSYTQPPVTANASFLVVARPRVNVTYPTTTTTQVTGAPTGAAPLPARELYEITITSYKKNISAARGWITSEIVVVENTGEMLLSNISLVVIGIPTTWYEVTPSTVPYLPSTNTTIFLVKFNIPQDAEIKTYPISFVVVSSMASDERRAMLTVYESVRELLKVEIQRLKNALSTLKNQTEAARKAGKRVDIILQMISEAEEHIKVAEKNLAEEKFEIAMEEISTASNLIEKAKDLLMKMLAAPPRIAFFNIWIILLIGIILASSITIFVWMRRKPVVKPPLAEIRRFMELAKIKKSEEELRKEKEKLIRMLGLIERERKEGLITESVYVELKKSIEGKLEKIKRALGEV